MTLIELLLTSIALSMDALTVSICKGLVNNFFNIKKALIIGLSFGIFQALMPLIGYYLGNIFKDSIIMYDHYIALFLLSFIGINMIKETKEKNVYNEKINFKEIILLSIATSIDALIVGITLSFLNVNLKLSLVTIGSITFILSTIGYLLGTYLGHKFGKISQIIGGITLIIIGIKTFLEHTILK